MIITIKSINQINIEWDNIPNHQKKNSQYNKIQMEKKWPIKGIIRF